MAKSKKNKGGRPSYNPSDDTRRAVEILAGLNMTHGRIASIFGITEPTLRKHFPEELARASAAVESKLMNKLMGIVADVKNENPSLAFKAIQFILCCRFGWSQYAPAPAREQKPAELGKKEQADIEAQTAHKDTEWGSLLH